MYSVRVCCVLLALLLARGAPGQISSLQIRVVEGEGEVHPAGARSIRPLTVEVRDEGGRPVAQAAVSLHVPEDGPGGTFQNGLHTVVATTGADGRASIRGLRVNRVPGRFQIRIFASKEQARAGTVSFQVVGAAARSAGWHGKWAALAALAGGGALAGLLAAGRSSGASEGAPPVQPPALTIGPPVVTVGKP